MGFRTSYAKDDETPREIETIIRKIDGRLHGTDGFRINAREVCPSVEAAILISERDDIDCQQFMWGLLGYDKKQLIFNARSETALEKRMFREAKYAEGDFRTRSDSVRRRVLFFPPCRCREQFSGTHGR